MSKCDLSFELERTPPQFRPGDVLNGKLRVEVNSQCACQSLTVELVWRTHGAGNKDTGTPQIRQLGAFEWLPGMSQEYPFSFTMPAGPVSYHGHYIFVDWYLIARADVPWAIDPKAEQDVLLLPAPAQLQASNSYRGAPKYVARHHELGSEATKHARWIRWFAFLAFPAFILIFFHDAFYSNGTINWMFTLPLGLMCTFLVRMVWKDVRNFAAKQKLGDIDLFTDPMTATRGETISVLAVLEPKSKGFLNHVRATLVGEETAVSGSGTNKTTRRHPLGKIEADMASGVHFLPGERQEFTTEIKVPADAAPTFRAEDNKVCWTVQVSLDVKAWPDLEESVELDVYPS